MRDMMLTMVEHDGPAAMRYPRGNGIGAALDREPQLLEIGKGEITSRRRRDRDHRLRLDGPSIFAGGRESCQRRNRNHGRQRPFC